MTRSPTPDRSPRPRDAATVVLVRDFHGRPEVLMGRRRTRDAWSDLYVFPGGRVDPTDHRIAASSELRDEVSRRLERAATPARARALAVAAIRETFEETGLRIGRTCEQRAIGNAGDSWTRFAAGGFLPDLGSLHLLCRAVTPPRRPKRFNARFFLVDAETLDGANGEAVSNGELGDLRWFPFEETAELPLPKITEAVLAVLRDRLHAGRLETPQATPLFQTRGSRHLQLLESG